VIASSELSVQRQLTKVFIEADKIQVVLSRSTPTDDGAGGTIPGSPVDLPPQTMRLIPLGDGAQERFNANGVAVTPSYMLMGYHDSDMEREDQLVIGGRRYEIVFINENQQYEKKGEVAYRGE